MPSFRITMAMGSLRPGIAPEAVLPTAKAATAHLATVEAADIAVISGAARLVVRFEADDAEIAAQVAAYTAEPTDAVAEVLHWRVTRRSGNRWVNP